MDRYIAFIQNELIIIIIIISLILIVINPLYQQYHSQYCIVNKSESVYDGFYGRIVRNYEVVEPC